MVLPTGKICCPPKSFPLDISGEPRFMLIPTKFPLILFCKTDFNMEEIGNEEKDYAKYPLPKFYKFPSVEAKERILYANFLKINKEVKDMISEIQEFNKK